MLRLLYSNFVVDTVLHMMEGRIPKTGVSFSTIQTILVSPDLFFIFYEYSYYFSDEFLYRPHEALLGESW